MMAFGKSEANLTQGAYVASALSTVAQGIFYFCFAKSLRALTSFPQHYLACSFCFNYLQSDAMP